MNENKIPLYLTTLAGTDIWNDSCSISELEYAIANGAVGATTNPSIVIDVLKKEMNLWKDRIQEIIQEMPEATEDDIAWKLIEEMAVKGAALLYPIFEREKGMKGRISAQTNAKFYRDAKRITEHAIHLSKLAPNMQIKIPATKAGIEAIEEATFQGVNINATVCFTVPQSLAVAEAVERGLNRRQAKGLPIDDMTPVCTIMVGRTDDWIKKAASKSGLLINPECYEWAGVACAKKTYQIYKQRKYRTKMLFGALRNHYHWSEFVGGDLILTINYKWQVMINESDIPAISRIDIPVKDEMIEPMLKSCPEFKKAYDENGLTPEEFDTYGATCRTMLGFFDGYDQLVKIIRGFMILNPD